ncbi:MAG: uncharacterized membrane-anchored protein YhcB (DUF1043 family) [Myxococcota bacterium]|jgi:uncharacterized membrane-anchored protein YhcB (DUF1043 family)
MSDGYEDDVPSTTASVAAWVMPMITVLTALVIGLLAGAILGFILFRGETTTQVVLQELTNEELDSLCAVKVDEAVGEAADELTVAQERVATLQDDVFGKERQVAEMEAEMTRRAERGRSLSAEVTELREELEAARTELTTLKAELAAAVEEKEELFVQLRYTEEQLAEQRVETSVAREDALSFKWQTFVTASQLEVCEKGGRRRMGRCRETVTESIASFRTEFEHCIRSGQEMPGLQEAERTTEVLPMFSKWIDQEERITRDWYVLLCDPTLPEASGWDTPGR